MAIDGNPDTFFSTDYNETVTMDVFVQFYFFAVDFNEIVTVNRVVWYNRMDCCGNLTSSLSISINGGGSRNDNWWQNSGNVPLNSFSDPALIKAYTAGGGAYTLTLDPPRSGRFLVLRSTQLPANVTTTALQIAELEAYGMPAGTSVHAEFWW